MKKAICMILAALTVLGVLASSGCANSTAYTDTDKPVVTTDDTKAAEVTSVEENETEAETDALPQVSYGGEEFRVLSQTDGNRHYDIYAEEADESDAVHDAVFNRNLAVQDRFCVSIVVEYDTFSAVNAAIDRMVNSGTDEFDLCFVHMVSGASMALDNDFVAFEDLEYIDLSKP
jgi:hypothetical protein